MKKTQYAIGISLLVILIGAAGPATLAAQPVTESLIPAGPFSDEAFIQKSGPRFRAYSISVHPNKLIYSERDRDGGAQTGCHRELSIPASDERVSQAFLATGLMVRESVPDAHIETTRGGYSFFDRNSHELVEVDAHSGRERRRPSVAMRSYASLSNGNFILYNPSIGAQAARPRMSEEQRREMLEVLGADEFKRMLVAEAEEEAKLSAYDLFLVNSDFEVIEPLEAAASIVPSSVSGGGGMPNAITLTAKKIRPQHPAGRFAVVFSQHQPDIRLYTPTGQLLHTFSSPGPGAESPKELELDGARVLYQSDVLAVRKSLYIVDNITKVLWQTNLDGGVVGAYDLPFFTLDIERQGQHLFMLGRDGELASFEMPNMHGRGHGGSGGVQ